MSWDDTGNDEIEILDDGFVRRKDGQPVEDEEEQAAPENDSQAILLGVALAPSPNIAAPSLHSPEIQAILNCRDEPEEKRLVRAARLEKVAALLRQSEEEEENSQPEEEKK